MIMLIRGQLLLLEISKFKKHYLTKYFSLCLHKNRVIFSVLMKKILFTNVKKIKALVALVVILLSLFNPFLVSKASAASLINANMRFYRLKTNTAVDASNAKLLIRLTPASTTAIENEIRITFAGNGTQGAASYGVDSDETEIDVSTTGLPAGCTAVPGIGTEANAVSGAQVDFTISPTTSESDFNDGTLYCFFITGGIDSPTSAGEETNRVETLTGSNTQVEYLDTVTYHLSDDQVTVSAVVPPTFTFTLGANSTSFTANLSTAAIRSTTGVTGTVTTNAANGWTAYVRSSNGSLSSVTASDTIPTQGSIDGTPETLSNGSEYYQLDVDETADPETNGSIAAEYNGGASEGGTLSTADLEAIASGSTATSGYVFTMVGKATIAGTTKAANDYTDTWTVVAAGNF